MRKLGAIAAVAMTLALSAGTSSATSPTTAQFQPRQVALASAGGEIFVLGYKICTVGSCSGPELWVGTGSSFVQRTAPPGTSPDYLSQLVFANALDGYVLNQVASIYATTNGGASWTHASFAPHTVVSSLASSDGWFYAATARCVTRGEATTCDDYRLERSLAGSATWSSVPIPYANDLSGLAYMGVTAWGRRVTVSVPGPREGETLLRSEGGLAPLRVAGRSDWTSTTGACELTASSSSSTWEICQTGMEQAFLYSNDGGGHFRMFWHAPGTTLVPVSDGVAYRCTPSYALPKSLQNELAITTNGGASFTPVDHLPFAGGWAFLSVQHGYVIEDKNYASNNTELLQTSDGGHSWSKIVFESAT